MVDCIRPVKAVVARKQHRCDWCGKTIEPGETYNRSTWRYDSVYDFHECTRCEPYVVEMWSTVAWYSDAGLNHEDFRYFMEEHYPDVLKEWTDEQLFSL